MKLNYFHIKYFVIQSRKFCLISQKNEKIEIMNMVDLNLDSRKLRIKIKNPKLKFLKLLTPILALIASINVQLIFSYIFLFIIPFINLITPLNQVSASLLILFLSQICGSIIVYFIFLRFFHIQKDFSDPMRGSNLSCNISLISMGYCICALISIFLTFIFTLLNLKPQTGYDAILPETQYLTDTFTIILYFTTPTLGAGVFEELSFRRMAIPLLEKHGLSPFSAVLTTASFFSISHIPNDLLNGNLSGGIIHSLVVFFIGLVAGLMYIFSRKVIYSIIIHATLNFLSFAGYLIALIGVPMLMIINSSLSYALIILGGIILIYFLSKFIYKPNWLWRIKLREKSRFSGKLSILGFLIVGTIYIVIITLIQFIAPFLISIGATVENTLLVIISLFLVSLLAILWIGNKKNQIIFDKRKKIE